FVAKEKNGEVYTYKFLEENSKQNLKEFAKFYLTSSETYGWQFSEYRFPFDDIIAFAAIIQAEEGWRFLGKKKLDL
ncbi:8823_t:CDS:2, partial [Ambispora gerdemannii]